MFIVASFSIVGGLKTSMDRLEGNFSADHYLITHPGDTGLEAFNPSAVMSHLTECAYGFFVDVTLNTTDTHASAFYLVDDSKLFPSVNEPLGNLVYVPDNYDFGRLTLTSRVGESHVNVTGVLNAKEFPRDWLLGSREVVDLLSGQAGMANFAVTGALSDGQRAHLESDGFSVQSMTGIIDFLTQSATQIQDDMMLVLLPSSFVIAVLSYGFTGSETADRRHDIGILKTIGAGRTRILRLLLANAFLLSLWGGILGLAFGIVLSYAISTAASAVFSSVFLMSVDPFLLVLALAATVAAGVVGASVPSLRMTRSSPIEDLREVAR